jgi:hypothetical protein
MAAKRLSPARCWRLNSSTTVAAPHGVVLVFATEGNVARKAIRV